MPRALIHNRASEPPPDQAATDSGLNILFLAAFPLFAWLFQGSFSAIATAMVELWILSLALRLINAGQRCHRLYDATPGARAPRLPRKLLGSLLLGVMVTVLAGHHFHSLFLPLLIGFLGFGLGLAAFGMDPIRDKPGVAQPIAAEDDVAEETLSRADHALAQIADRVAMLEDLEITRRTEAARSLVMRMLRSLARDPHALSRIERPVAKFIGLLDAEANRLCGEDPEKSSVFVRRRYLAKLEVMTESFETSARKTRVRGDKDAFELEADLLLDRMPRHNLA
ncbi:hypothetical protein [Sagittula salina]|uniref:5-bromo-4-chloroindolyl phosphate hydrolysis protein n=1 Tax=Sagittula salina TaxID=2820268 RepID=A0A940MSP6_9RHOB|nr:hypothetical protein [Sagittula salina]MBP0482279.1 hypothetical protein [Sagittula salina]